MASTSTRANVILTLTDRMTPRLRKMAVKMDRIAVKAQRAGLAMGVGAALLGAGIAKTLKSASELDDNMRKVQARSQDIDSSGLEELTKQAKLLGRTTSFTTAEVSELMATLAQAGLNGEQIKAQTANMLNFARANGIATDAAAEFAFAAGAAFGIDKSDAAGIEHVTDVMTYAASASFQSVEDIGEAFKMVAPIANETGQSIEDVGASLAILANMGIKGSMAGRQMKNVLLRMGKEGSEIAKTLGVDIKDTEGNMKNLPMLLKDFHEKTKNMGNVQAMNIFNEAFGKIGLNAAMLGAEGADGIRKVSEEMSKLNGFTLKTANIMDAGIGGSLRMFWSAVDGVVIAIGESLVPVINLVSGGATLLLNSITPLIENFKSLGLWITGAFAALAGGAALLITVAGVMTVLSGAVSLFAFFTATVIPSLIAFAGFVTSVGAPILLIIAGIAGITYGLLMMFDVLNDISRFFDDIAGIWVESFDSIKDAMMAGDWEGVWEIMKLTALVTFSEIADDLGQTFRDTFQAIVKAFGSMIRTMRRMGLALKHGISNMLIDAGEGAGYFSEADAESMRGMVFEENQAKFNEIMNSANEWADSVDEWFKNGTAGAKQDLADAKKRQAEKREEERKAREAEEARKARGGWAMKYWNRGAKVADAGKSWWGSEKSKYQRKAVTHAVAKVTETTTLGTTGAFSAASLRASLAKDSLQIQKDQLTVMKQTLQLTKRKQSVWGK